MVPCRQITARDSAVIHYHIDNVHETPSLRQPSCRTGKVCRKLARDTDIDQVPVDMPFLSRLKSCRSHGTKEGRGVLACQALRHKARKAHGRQQNAATWLRQARGTEGMYEPHLLARTTLSLQGHMLLRDAQIGNVVVI